MVWISMCVFRSGSSVRPLRRERNGFDERGTRASSVNSLALLLVPSIHPRCLWMCPPWHPSSILSLAGSLTFPSSPVGLSLR